MSSTIQKVLIIGSGTMGQQIGLQCAAHGFDVVMHDISADRLEFAAKGQRTFAGQLVEDMQRPDADVELILSRISYVEDPVAAARDVDLISESIPEDVWLKRSVFQKFHKLCPDRTLFTTNTSTLLPGEIAKQSGRPQKFAALHFHPNVWDSNVVDVMPVKRTDPQVAETLREFAIDIDQTPIVFDREYRGYVINRFLVGVFREALSMVAREVVTPAEADHAFRTVLKAEHGPCEWMDRIGLDTMLSINQFWCKRLLKLPLLDPVYRQNNRLLQSYIDKGHLGVKSGQGFFKYDASGAAMFANSPAASDVEKLQTQPSLL